MVIDRDAAVPCGAECSAGGCCCLQISSAALELFSYGQEQAAKRGLLLVDTKYEFGRDSEGTIRLIDEIHTPDSSRHVSDTCALLHLDVSEGGATRGLLGLPRMSLQLPLVWLSVSICQAALLCRLICECSLGSAERHSFLQACVHDVDLSMALMQPRRLVPVLTGRDYERQAECLLDEDQELVRLRA